MSDEDRLLQEKYSGTKNAAYDTDCARLKNGEPLAYVIGHIPFLDTTIALTSKPLIPRPETEWWTEHVIRDLAKRTATALIGLDLCAGSGAIGVALLHAEPRITMTFTDSEARHLPTIQENLKRNGIDPTRATLLTGNLFESCTGIYDSIVSNPPYIAKKRKADLPDSLRFEPEEALFGGDSGLDLIKKIIHEAPHYLAPDGTLYIEFDDGQEKQIENFFEQGSLSPTFHRDQFGLWRFVVAQWRHDRR